MNQVNIIGRITKDLEVRQVGGDKTLLNFSIAYNERWGDNERVNYFDIEAWGRQAEAIAQYFKKGHRIGVTGKLKQDRFEAKDGSGKRSRVSIVLREFEFIEPKGYSAPGESGGGAGGASERAGGGGGGSSDFGGLDDAAPVMDDDEVPF